MEIDDLKSLYLDVFRYHEHLTTTLKVHPANRESGNPLNHDVVISITSFLLDDLARALAKEQPQAGKADIVALTRRLWGAIQEAYPSPDGHDGIIDYLDKRYPLAHTEEVSEEVSENTED